METDHPMPPSGIILLVDDMPDNLRLLTSMLEEHGYDIRTVTGGSGALTAVSLEPPDLILLDVAMPDMNGYEVCRRLRANPRTRDIPVLFISALSGTDDKIRAFEAGGVDYISKPFHAQEVLARVHTHLRVVQGKRDIARINTHLQHTIDELEQRNEEMRLVNQFGSVIQTTTSVDELWDASLPFLHLFFPLRAAALSLFNDDSNAPEATNIWQTKTTIAQHDIRTQHCPLFSNTRNQAMDITNRSLTCMYHAQQRGLPDLCVALHAGGSTLGGLHLWFDPASPKTISSNLERLATTVGDLFALALANLRLRDELRQQAIRDALTGLHNRRYLDETLERELYRAGRDQHPLALILADIDHFKAYNDTYGHHAGDALLRMVGQQLRQHIRMGDISCRYGGEEFVFVLPDTTLETAYDRAEDLRSQLKAMQVMHHKQMLPTVTMSFGIAGYPLHADNAAHLFAAADAALYQAKQQGRDRVVTAEQHVFSQVGRAS